MTDRLLAAMIGAWCLLWLAAAVAPAFVGRRRWREGLPGGRRAVAAGVCGAAPPAFLLGLCLVRGVWPDEPAIWLHHEYRGRFAAAFLAAPALFTAALALLVAAGATTADELTGPVPPGTSS